MDGTNQGISAERAIETILGGKPAPQKDEEKTPEWWLDYLTNTKDDDINGYSAHAEVMAKYIIKAYKEYPELKDCPISTIYKEPIDWNNPVILAKDLSEMLKEVYPDEKHPFRMAFSEATGFTWGWAFNISRFALRLSRQPNPAIIEI